MNDEYITPHFSWAELACHDGTPVPAELQMNAIHLCDLLEVIRADFGEPLVVVSGYRTHQYNMRVGGAPKSQHERAAAADIRPVVMAKVAALAALVTDRLADGDPRYAELGGFGTYPQWIHVDIRARKADGAIARWEGDGVGSEVTG